MDAEIVEKWNEAHEPGIAVIVTDDFGKETATKTRSYAELLGGHTPVIWLEGITGCYDLTRVRVASEVV